MAYVVAAVAATVLRSAVPKDPPICCDVFSIALATPVSWEETACSEVEVNGIKTRAIPLDMIKSAGSTCVV